MRFAAGAVVALLLTTPVAAQTVVVTGTDGSTITLGAADLAALPRRSMSLTAHGQTHAYEGAALADVIARVGAPLGQALRGPALATYVLVEAADGYRVVLSLAEVDPAMSPMTVLLADEVDGAPIPAEDGPFRLVVEGDARPARSARQVTTITVRTAD